MIRRHDSAALGRPSWVQVAIETNFRARRSRPSEGGPASAQVPVHASIRYTKILRTRSIYMMPHPPSSPRHHGATSFGHSGTLRQKVTPAAVWADMANPDSFQGHCVRDQSVCGGVPADTIRQQAVQPFTDAPRICSRNPPSSIRVAVNAGPARIGSSPSAPAGGGMHGSNTNRLHPESLQPGIEAGCHSTRAARARRRAYSGVIPNSIRVAR